jgi:hypothetical protein
VVWVVWAWVVGAVSALVDDATMDPFSSLFGCCGEDRKGSSSDKIIFTQEKGGEEGWAASADAMAIFALLDVDGSGAIEKNEFKERLRDSEDLARVFFSYCGYSEYRVVFTTCVYALLLQLLFI